MNLLIAAFGQIKSADPYYILYQQYLKRLPWKIALHELQDKTTCKADSLVIMNHIPKNSYVFVLDESGKNYSSAEFAHQLQTQMLNGRSHFSFLLGSAFGFDQQVLQKADQVIALGKITLPHKLARITLIEQLYRAYTIINHHPYHKE